MDPDDATLNGIRRAGAQVIFYGVPVLPGSMSAYARLGRAHILGAPACLVHEPITAFDLFLAPLLADLPLTARTRPGLGTAAYACDVPSVIIRPVPLGIRGNEMSEDIPDLKELIILIRGAGEMATGVAYRLFQSGFRVCLTEIAKPLAVRREVSFSEAVRLGGKRSRGSRPNGLKIFRGFWTAGTEDGYLC